MAPDLLLTEASMADAMDLAPRLRPADLAEIHAAGQSSALAALTRSLSLSSHAFAIRAEGEVIGLWGVGPLSLLGGIGCPWMLASDGVTRHAGAFLRGCRASLAFARACYPRLENRVDARNALAIRWLRWMGFHLDPALPFGPLGLPFHRFTLGV